METWLRPYPTRPVWKTMMSGLSLDLTHLQSAFGERLQTNVPLAR